MRCLRARHNHRLSEAEQPVFRAIARWFDAEGLDARKRLLFQLKICVKVYLSGFDRLMTEPERDRGWIDTVGAKPHRRRVSKHMRTDPFLLQ